MTDTKKIAIGAMRRSVLCVSAALVLCLILLPGQALASEQVTQLWSHEFTRFGEHIISLAISSDGNYVVAGTDYDTIYLFSSSGSTPLWSYRLPGDIAYLGISADGRYIAVASGYLYLFSRENNTPIWKSDVGVTSAAISANGEYIAAAEVWASYWSEAHKVYLFSRSSSTPLWSYETATMGSAAVSISSDGGYIVASGERVGGYYGGTYTNCYVYLISKEGALAWSRHIYTDDISSISARASSDGNYVLVAEPAGVSLFSRSDNAPFWTYRASGEGLRSVAISADGNYIAIGTGDYNNYTGYVRLFSRTDNTPLWSYKTSSSDLSTYGVYSVVISADGNYIAASERFYAGGFSRHGLYLFSSSSGTPIWSSVPSYWTSPGTREVAGISSDGSHILIHNSSRDAVELYERRTILPSTSLAVSPSSFSISPGSTTTLTATLTSGGTPLAGKTITWTKTAGDVYLSSGTTDSQGRVTVTYTAPSTEGSVTATASFAGDAQYAPSSGNTSGDVTKTAPPGGTESAFPWWLLVLIYFIISTILAAWVYRDSKDRKMNRGAWAGLTFLASVVGLAAYLKRRKSKRER